MNYKQDYFGDLVGLESAKKKLNFYINNFFVSKRIPHLLLSGPRGSGKTELARHISRAIGKKHVEINSASIEKLSDFFDIVSQHLMNCDVVLFMDESEGIIPSLSLALCTILNSTKENYGQYTFGGIDYRFYFNRLNFIFATTEIQKMHHALVDRTNIIENDFYNRNHLKLIVKNNLKKIKIDEDVLD